MNIYAFTLEIESQTPLYLVLMRGSGASFMLAISSVLVYLNNLTQKIQETKKFDYRIILILYLVLGAIYTFIGEGEIGENLEPVYAPWTTAYIFTIYILLIIIFLFQAIQVRKVFAESPIKKKIDMILIAVSMFLILFFTILLANAQFVPVQSVIFVFLIGSVISNLMTYKSMAI
jgi:hypothetical protein